MSMSVKTSFLSEILEGKPIPKGKLAFFQERFRDHLYELVVTEFLKREKEEGLTRREVAKRIHCAPEQITRWFAAPGNWEIDTATNLILAVAKAEPRVILTPLVERMQQQARTGVSRVTKIVAESDTVKQSETTLGNFSANTAPIVLRLVA